jgi:hypothetical protein
MRRVEVYEAVAFRDGVEIGRCCGVVEGEARRWAISLKADALELRSRRYVGLRFVRPGGSGRWIFERRRWRPDGGAIA